MKEYIVIEYDPETVAEDEMTYDLYEAMLEMLNTANLHAKIAEFTGCPRRRDILKRMDELQ